MCSCDWHYALFRSSGAVSSLWARPEQAGACVQIPRTDADSRTRSTRRRILAIVVVVVVDVVVEGE